MKLPDMLTLSTVDHDYGKKRWFCLLSKLRDRALQLIMGHVLHGLEVVASLASVRLWNFFISLSKSFNIRFIFFNSLFEGALQFLLGPFMSFYPNFIAILS